MSTPTLEELLSQKEAAEKALRDIAAAVDEARNQERKTRVAEALEFIRKHGLTQADLFPAVVRAPRAAKKEGSSSTGGTGNKAPIKYFDPETNIGWSGRGHVAKIFKQRMAEGRKLEEFLVKN